jgi:hypothetical protein
MTVDNIMLVLKKMYADVNLTREEIIEKIRNIITHHELSKKLDDFDGKKDE